MESVHGGPVEQPGAACLDLAPERARVYDALAAAVEDLPPSAFADDGMFEASSRLAFAVTSKVARARMIRDARRVDHQ